MAEETIEEKKSAAAEKRLQDSLAAQDPRYATPTKTSSALPKPMQDAPLSSAFSVIPQAASPPSDSPKEEKVPELKAAASPAAKFYLPPSSPILSKIKNRKPTSPSFSLSSPKDRKEKDDRLNSTRWPSEPRAYVPSLSLLPVITPPQLSPKRRTATERFEEAKRIELQRLKNLRSDEPYEYSFAFKTAHKELEAIQESEAIQELEAKKDDPYALLQFCTPYLGWHAANRVDYFFYTMVVYHNSQLNPHQSDTILQYGKGRNSLKKTKQKLTAACHSNYLPQLMDESIMHDEVIMTDGDKPPMPRRSILCGTHFGDVGGGGTVEMFVAGNNLDSNLEGKKTNPSPTRSNTLDILHRVCKGEIDPVQGITEYLILMEQTFTQYQTETHSKSYIRANRKTAPAIIKPDLLRISKAGTVTDKLLSNSPADKTVNPQYTDLMLRLTESEVAECKKNPEARKTLYPLKFDKLKREILNSAAAHVVSSENFEHYVTEGNSYFTQQQYELALECYEYALLYNLKNVDVLYRLARANMALAKYGDALQLYHRAHKEAHPSLKETLLAEKYLALEHLLSQANSYLEQGAYQPARINFACAIYYVPHSQKAECFHKKGLALQGLSDYAKAEIAFKMAIQLDPSKLLYQEALTNFYLVSKAPAPSAIATPKAPDIKKDESLFSSSNSSTFFSSSSSQESVSAPTLHIATPLQAAVPPAPTSSPNKTISERQSESLIPLTSPHPSAPYN